MKTNQQIFDEINVYEGSLKDSIDEALNIQRKELIEEVERFLLENKIIRTNNVIINIKDWEKLKSSLSKREQ